MNRSASTLPPKLRLAIENAPVPLWIREPNGIVSYGNQTWRDATGLSEEPLDADAFFSLFHPDDMGKRLHDWLICEDHAQPFQMELRMRGADNAYRRYLVRMQPIREKGKGLVFWVGAATDIDDQYRSIESLQFLSEAGNALAGSLDLKTTLRRVVELAVPHIADWCALYILRGKELELAADAHHDPRQRDIGTSILSRHKLEPDERMAKVLRTGETIFLPTLAPDAAVGAEFGIASTILTPLRSRGRILGILQLAMQNGRRAYTPTDVRVAQDLARRTATAIENAQLYEREQQTAQYLRFLADAGLILSETLDLNKRLERLIAIIVPQLATWASVNLVAPDGSLQTVAIAHRDTTLAPIIAALRGPYYGKLSGENGATSDVLRDGRSRLVPEIDDAFLRRTILAEKLLVIRALGARSGVFIPLKVRDRVLGSISIIRTQHETPFSEGDLPLLEELARRAAVAIDNAQMYTREQMVAETFQAASLPAPLPNSPGLAFSGFYEPGRSEALIGGDWYDALALPNGRVLISIGDVSGSGLHAAIIMGSVRQVIRGVAHITIDPNAILEAADKALRSQHPDRIVTAFVGIIDPAAKTLTYASAGHPPPLLRRANGTIDELTEHGLPLGLRSPEDPATVIALTQDDILVLYTDGLVESTRDIFEGQARLHAALSETLQVSDRDLARTLVGRVLRNAPSSDDVAVLTVRVRAIINDDLEARRRARSGRSSEGNAENSLL